PLGGFGVGNLIIPEFDAFFLVNCLNLGAIFSGGSSLSRAFRYGKVEIIILPLHSFFHIDENMVFRYDKTAYRLTLLRICIALDCDIGDIVEVVRDNPTTISQE
ncbi:MAG: hypothetical protein K5746_01855, partial [Clostridiales bacterium]|nr:hypothetical protein [Clostridiales bacterium]